MDKDSAMRGSFMKLFDYISGGNSGKTKIPMTGPVLTKIEPGQGPNCESTFTMSFYNPYTYQVGSHTTSGFPGLTDSSGPASSRVTCAKQPAPCAPCAKTPPGVHLFNFPQDRAAAAALLLLLLPPPPQGANAANVPKPTGSGVFISNLPAMEVYVMSYGGFSNPAMERQKAAELIKKLEAAKEPFSTSHWFTAGKDVAAKWGGGCCNGDSSRPVDGAVSVRVHGGQGGGQSHCVEYGSGGGVAGCGGGGGGEKQPKSP
jgi:hypothetical protein